MATPSHQTMMELALQQAKAAMPVDVPVGAVLVHNQTVIAQAYNCRERDHDPTGHAELKVLQSAGASLQNWRLTNATLYVTLEPCPMCAAAILQARLARLVYGAYDPVMGACGSRYNLLAEAPHLEVIGGVLEEPCGQLLRQFFQSRENR